jgi:hypothetical protein
MIGDALSAIKDAYGLPERSYLLDKEKVILQFDVVETESWSSTASVSSYPVEKGVEISDHVKVNPESVSLTATITNHTGISSQDQMSLLRIRGGGSVEDVISEKLASLENWRDNGALLTYFGAVKEPVENLVITSLSSSRSSGSGEAYELQIQMQRVVVAETVDLFSRLPVSAREVRKKGRVISEKLSLDVDITGSSRSNIFTG